MNSVLRSVRMDVERDSFRSAGEGNGINSVLRRRGHRYLHIGRLDLSTVKGSNNTAHRKSMPQR
jgi:hypothetical protein